MSSDYKASGVIQRKSPRDLPGYAKYRAGARWAALLGRSIEQAEFSEGQAAQWLNAVAAAAEVVENGLRPFLALHGRRREFVNDAATVDEDARVT